jgi:hypothetical protein
MPQVFQNPLADRPAVIFPPEVELTHGIPITTQCVWRSTNRYGFRNLVIKLGRKVAYDRQAFEAWIDSRRQRGGESLER